MVHTMLSICYTEWSNLLYCCSLHLQGTGDREFWWAQPPQHPNNQRSTPACRRKVGRGSGDMDSSPSTVTLSSLLLGHRLRHTRPSWSHLYKMDAMGKSHHSSVSYFAGIDPVIPPAQASASVQSLTGSADTHYFNTTIFDVPHRD